MNKLLIAAAGAGKTTYLIDQALSISDNVLITTFTIENAESIRQKMIKRIGCIPPHIHIKTWFSFLLQHGVKPFQGSVKEELYTQCIRGVEFSEKQSGIKFQHPKGFSIPYNEETEFFYHYFDKHFRIYSDKLSKFVVRANEITKGDVIQRLVQVFPNIFIDEVQDLSGYDLTILELLFRSQTNILLVGDPRQTTYLTHWEKKNAKYHYGKIELFITEQCRKKDKIIIDTTTLNYSHRNNSMICDFSSRLYNNYAPTQACNCSDCHHSCIHEGVFVVLDTDVKHYFERYGPTILRYNKSTKTISSDNIYTFGSAKGKEFDDVLIYPTQAMEQWLINFNNSLLEPTTKAKFYVAITRARHSVAFVVSSHTYSQLENHTHIQKWRI